MKLRIFFVCVWGGGGEEGGDSLIQTALKYFHFGQFSILWCSGLSYERTRV